MPDRYKLFGLCVASELDLPELVRAPDDQPADVAIRCGALLDGLATDSGASMAGAAMVLNIPDVARYLISDGREILVEAITGASERNVRLFLLGSAFGALLHQRGLLPLHANAIEVDGRAIGFLGHSGAGKSTIAAWFHDRGHPILADDVCVVTFGEDGRPLAHPGIPRFRLWRDALERRGDDADQYQRSFDGMDKYDVPTSLGPTRDSIALDRLYLLGRSKREAVLPAIRRLSGVAAVDALIANTYRGAYLKMMGGAARHAAACIALARAIPIYAADRIWGHECLDSEAMKLDAHARGVDEAIITPAPAAG